jgi:hypothetical protein
VAHFVYAQPGLLKQIVGVTPAYKLRQKKTMQLRAQAIDKRRRGIVIALLIASHQRLQIDV